MCIKGTKMYRILSYAYGVTAGNSIHFTSEDICQDMHCHTLGRNCNPFGNVATVTSQLLLHRARRCIGHEWLMDQMCYKC